MSGMRIQIAKVAPILLTRRREELLHDSTLPLSVRGSANVHFEKPWIPNFWSVAIRAAKPGSERFFDFPIGADDASVPWYFPSKEWWIAHATASHPPDGMGCDVDVHTKFLSSEGAVHEFDYATILADGTMQIVGRAGFADECAWWARAFGGRDKPP